MKGQGLICLEYPAAGQRYSFLALSTCMMESIIIIIIITQYATTKILLSQFLNRFLVSLLLIWYSICTVVLIT
jgi:hypothetical protein